MNNLLVYKTNMKNNKDSFAYFNENIKTTFALKRVNYV